jgi:hypothetical protein
MDEKRLSTQGITAMNDIGHSDVESYVRTLVSKYFGKQFEDAEDITGQPGDHDLKAPPLEPDQPNNRMKGHRNGDGS